MKLSIIMPVFNEERTVARVVKKVSQIRIPDGVTEIIIVNDASTDGTQKKLLQLSNEFPAVNIIHHKTNQGKGAAVKTGIAHATGDYIVIQDADEEYNPKDITRLVQSLTKTHQTVFGTRLKRLPHLLGEEKRPQFLLHFFGTRFLSLVTSILFGQWITDMETCYKLFPKDTAQALQLHEKGFAFEPEITAKLMKKGLKIKEIPITTRPRGKSEGKKLRTLIDGPQALGAIIKYRFFD